jgi:DNA end-binding protein Ku
VFLKPSLVSVPVTAYTASAAEGREIRLNQLPAECHSRIHNKKTCPIHGEVPSDQSISGYEHGKDQYVIVDTDELDKLRTEDDKAIRERRCPSVKAADRAPSTRGDAADQVVGRPHSGITRAWPG